MPPSILFLNVYSFDGQLKTININASPLSATRCTCFDGLYVADVLPSPPLPKREMFCPSKQIIYSCRIGKCAMWIGISYLGQTDWVSLWKYNASAIKAVEPCSYTCSAMPRLIGLRICQILLHSNNGMPSSL